MYYSDFLIFRDVEEKRCPIWPGIYRIHHYMDNGVWEIQSLETYQYCLVDEKTISTFAQPY